MCVGPSPERGVADRATASASWDFIFFLYYSIDTAPFKYVALPEH